MIAIWRTKSRLESTMSNTEWPNVKYNYQGASVLVTGGTSGIGAGIAAAYRDAGAKVTITGTRPSPSEYDADFNGYNYIQFDVEYAGDTARVAKNLQSLDILVNNAGIALNSLGLDEYQPDIFGRAVKMLLTGVYEMSHACLGMLKESKLPGGASIIGIASITSYLGMGFNPGYNAAKTGLIGMTRSLAIGWAKDNIRVNAVAAGVIDTRMTSAFLQETEMSDPLLQRTPLGRFGKPDDVSGAVLFLSSAAASFITGQSLPVDGGYTIQG
jgi:NAD(P)-dependent dehydrogenase (short-subunit alcohol dehydrogenase family)